MQIVILLFGLGSLACFIPVLIKLFQQKGAGHGILGLICGLYTFIWGWTNTATLKNKGLMIGWTVCIVAQLICQVIIVSGQM